jgi:hypothetical protein
MTRHSTSGCEAFRRSPIRCVDSASVWRLRRTASRTSSGSRKAFSRSGNIVLCDVYSQGNCLLQDAIPYEWMKGTLFSDIYSAAEFVFQIDQQPPRGTMAAYAAMPRSGNRHRCPRWHLPWQTSRTHAHAEPRAWLRWQEPRRVCPFPSHQESCITTLASSASEGGMANPTRYP